ncbi:hypothetical protein T09_9225 [Trichinella sp. T9]|nr:hypothetical protein T09_9225 [Trichinella sp. T9]
MDRNHPKYDQCFSVRLLLENIRQSCLQETYQTSKMRRKGCCSQATLSVYVSYRDKQHLL